MKYNIKQLAVTNLRKEICMINKRLIKLVPNAKIHIFKSVIFQWITLISNIVIMINLSTIISSIANLNSLKDSNDIHNTILTSALVISICIMIRFTFTILATIQNYKASKSVKKILRELVYKQLLKTGSIYKNKLSTASIIQVSVEGIEQLETYFGSYLPQFFYSMLAPITLFILLSSVSFKVAITLLLCVPLIPISIIFIQKIAKKLLSKYWDKYTILSDNFLENLQGINTLKIYQCDEYKHKQMNKNAEEFRKITMKVLTMQLNSIIIMDIVAYGGASLGIILALIEFSNNELSLFSTILIILLAVDFFLPLRLLGSYFHIAMNGMAASKKLFEIIDLSIQTKKTNIISNYNIVIKNLSFSYDSQINTLSEINLIIPENTYISIVGKSGSGKSTLASLLANINTNYSGSIKVGNNQFNTINHESISKNITMIGSNSYIFKGSIKDNLLIGNKLATEIDMWEILDQVNLSDFLKNENGLNTKISENGNNLSGGQCQRLALARALLHDSKIYIFDEATSNIDIDSEALIMDVIKKLSAHKTVIVISHRLANVINSDNIYMLTDGLIVENGTHKKLLSNKKAYSQLFYAQQDLESIKGDLYE